MRSCRCMTVLEVSWVGVAGTVTWKLCNCESSHKTSHSTGGGMELTRPEQWKELFSSVDNFIFDCDGVLWSGTGEAVPGAQDVIKFLRENGKAVYYLTNNSSKSRKEYMTRFDKLGFEAYEHEVYCTSYVAAYYLKHVLNFNKKVYLIGTGGFSHEMDLEGIPYIGPGPDPLVGEPSDWEKMDLDPEVGAVVVGYDREFSLMKVLKACSYLLDPGCLFIATNEDASLPIKSDKIRIPGTGCVVTSVRFGSGREPTVLGKPHTPVFDAIQKRNKLDPSRTVMVGDRLNTDIEFGINHGMKTLLVLTGISKREDVEGPNRSSTKPDYFAESVAGILTCNKRVCLGN